MIRQGLVVLVAAMAVCWWAWRRRRRTAPWSGCTRPPPTNRARASGAALGTAAELRIEEIAEGVAQHVEPEDGQADGDAGEHRHPRGLEHVGPARAAEHGAP